MNQHSIRLICPSYLLVAAVLLTYNSHAADFDLDRDRFLDRETAIQPGPDASRDIVGQRTGPTWSTYFSVNQNRADDSRQGAFSYEVTRKSGGGNWAFAIAGDAYSRLRSDSGDDADGLGDTAVKLTRKWKTSENAGLSLQGSIVLPTGADGITSDRTDEHLRLQFFRSYGVNTLTFDTRVTHIGGDIAAGVGEFKYRGRVAYQRDLPNVGALGVELQATARQGARANSLLGLDFSRDVGNGSYTLSASKGMASSNRDFYIELGGVWAISQN